MSYHLLTGATGLLGRYLVRDLGMEGVPLAVLVRPSRRNDPHERIEAICQTWESMLGQSIPRPHVLEGDISQPGLGLSDKDLRWAEQNCEALIHNAASLQFIAASPQSEPYRSNVEGARHVIEFAQQVGIEQFHHVSTAYVAGKRHGLVLESELDVGQEWGNDYELSKVEAEKLVREAKFPKPPTIFRPAIIIGDSKTGWSTTFHNFYVIAQIADTIIKQHGAPDATGLIDVSIISINVDGHERKNLVPVDWVSEVMSHIIRHADLHGETYHLTPRCPVTTRLMRDTIEEVFGIYGLGFYGAGEPREDSPEFEKLFHEHMKVYDSYWRDDPQFDATNTHRAAPHLPCPHVDRDMLARLSRKARQMRFRWNDATAKKRQAKEPQPCG
jgi:thioester reductase-like protein